MEQACGFEHKGIWTFEQIRDGKVIDSWEEKNIVVNEGLNDVLAVFLGAGTQKTAWYVGLFEGNYTPVASLTAATVASAATESTAYDESTRRAWTPASAASQQISNVDSKAVFTMNATKTLYGAFLVSNNTKGGTGGVLFAATRFPSARQVVATDQLLVTYTVQAASA